MSDTFDHRHDLPIRVKILDTTTGKTRWSPADWYFGTYWWTEGNGGCDCNRRVVFEGPEAVLAEHPCTSDRYKIVDVNPLLAGYSLSDFNEGYPV